MKHHQWFKFYPQDWLTDVELRSCSSAARGTLIDLMCLAHRRDDYGYFMDDQEPETRKRIAKCLSITRRTFDNHLTYLIQMQRICVADDGRLFIKRMVRDAEYTKQQSTFGTHGGNPTLKAPLKPDKNKSKNKKESKSKKEHGEFNNVLLTDEEHSKLLAIHGDAKLRAGIEILSSGIASKGYKYKSHYATLNKASWVWEKLAKGEQPKKGPQYVVR